MKLIHLIDTLDKINYGIWHAALVNSDFYQESGVDVECWSTGVLPEHTFQKVKFRLFSSPFLEGKKIIDTLNSNDKITFVSHGCWRFSTRLGAYAKRKGFRWVSVPHGMLEPWSMNLNAWKKKPYFLMMEKPMLQRANKVRAVAPAEKENLLVDFSHTQFVPNPIHPFRGEIKKVDNKLIVGFLGRLHQKKNPLELVLAWVKSGMNEKLNAELWLVGPDEGESEKINRIIRGEGVENIKLLGAKYGGEKSKVLSQFNTFFLPSQSEGFPTSVLEAMSHGAIPYISTECNMDFLKEDGVAFNSGKSVEEISRALLAVWSAFENNELEWGYVKEYVDDKFNAANIFNAEMKLYFE